MDSRAKDNRLYYAVIAGLFMLGITHVMAYWFYQPDDAFIYLVYVKNIISGNGLTFNGEVVEGFSSVSWPLLSALLAWPGFDPLQIAKILGASSYLATAILLLYAQGKLAPASNHWHRASLLLMFFSFPLLALWASAAMEGILYALLITASCYMYFLASSGTSLKTYFLAGLLFGLLAITRPEGAAFIASVFVYEASRHVFKQAINWKGIRLTLSAFFIMLTALLLWRYSTFGELLPTTVSAKTGNLQQQIKHGTAYVARFTLEYFYLVITYLLATAFIIARGGRTAWWAWLALIFVGGYTAFNLLVGGDWMIGYRFMMPVTPLLIAIPALALTRLNHGYVVAVIGFVAYSLWLSSQLHSVASAERWATMGDIIMGEHIAAMHLPTGSKIAVVDAGAIPYISGLPTIDMVGLNNKHISKIPGGFMAKWDNDYVLSEKPAIIQLHTIRDPVSQELLPSEDFRGTQLLFYTDEFQRWYTLDVTSIIPHLFIRRSTPLSTTENFYGFEAHADFDIKTSQLTLKLKKTGAGIWASSPQNENTVSWQIAAISNDGNTLFQTLAPIPKAMTQGDNAVLTVQLPGINASSYRLLACPVLQGSIKLPQCNSGFPVDLSPYPQTDTVHGKASFKDPNLGFSGWSTPEATHIWSLGKQASIHFLLKDSAALKGELTLDAASYGMQKVRISLNRKVVFSGTLNGDKLISAHAAPYREGLNILEIETPDSRPPGTTDSRQLGIALRSVQID